MELERNEGEDCKMNSEMSSKVLFKLSDLTRTLFVDTGNLMTFNELKRKASQSSSEELIESVTTTLVECLAEEKRSNCVQVDSTTVTFTNISHVTSISKEERRNLKISVKVFLGSFDPESLKEAVERTLKQLTISSIESLVVSFPPLPTKITLGDIQPLWEALEELVGKGEILTIGVCDLDVTQLRDLYSWSKIKPTTNQVNLESCCSMPPEMTTFAKDNVIQLLTHSDPKVILPEEGLLKIVSNVCKNGVNKWSTKWIVRYAVQVKCRGIIQSKGYIFCAHKNEL